MLTEQALVHSKLSCSSLSCASFFLGGNEFLQPPTTLNSSNAPVSAYVFATTLLSVQQTPQALLYARYSGRHHSVGVVILTQLDTCTVYAGQGGLSSDGTQVTLPVSGIFEVVCVTRSEIGVYARPTVNISLLIGSATIQHEAASIVTLRRTVHADAGTTVRLMSNKATPSHSTLTITMLSATPLPSTTANNGGAVATVTPSRPVWQAIEAYTVFPSVISALLSSWTPATDRAFSIAAWINTDTLSGEGTILAVTDGTVSNSIVFARSGACLSLQMNATHPPSTSTSTISKNGSNLSGTTPWIQHNTWQFVACTYDGRKTATGIHFIVNGVPKDSANAAATGNTLSSWPALTSAQIGQAPAAQHTFSGAIADVFIWDRVVTESDLVAYSQAPISFIYS